MWKAFFLNLLLFLPVCFCQAQKRPTHAQPDRMQASILPAEQTQLSFQVESLNFPLQFLDENGFQSRRVISGYFKVTIYSTNAWALNFNSPSATPVDDPTAPYYLVSLRSQQNNQIMPVGIQAQRILEGSGFPGPQVFLIDLLMDPPFNVKPGLYNGLVDFQLIAQ